MQIKKLSELIKNLQLTFRDEKEFPLLQSEQMDYLASKQEEEFRNFAANNPKVFKEMIEEAFGRDANAGELILDGKRYRPLSERYTANPNTAPNVLNLCGLASCEAGKDAGYFYLLLKVTPRTLVLMPFLALLLRYGFYLFF